MLIRVVCKDIQWGTQAFSDSTLVTCKVDEKSFYEILRDNKNRAAEVELDKLVLETTRAGWEVYNRKGTTYYGIATAAVGIIKAIINDENKIKLHEKGRERRQK